MVYLTPDESFSTNAQVPAANPIAGTENYSIGEKKKKDENSAALPKEKASETIRKGSVWPPHGMSQFPKRVSFEQDYHALFVLAIYIACLSDTLFVSKFHYIKVKVCIYCIYLH